MRLTCPSCAAAYEIDPGLIAPGGQHVQCSACQTRWFARTPALAGPAEAISEDDIIARLEARPRAPRPVPTAQPILRAVGPEAVQGPLAGGDFVWHEPAGKAPATERPYLRVVEAPPADAPAKEEAPAADASAAPAVDALPAEETPATARVFATTGRPRLELDPPAAAPAGESPEPAAAPRRRFWPGLAAGLGLVALAVAAYLLADTIAAALPAAAPWLDAYADAVEAGRTSLEARLGPEVEALRRALGDG